MIIDGFDTKAFDIPTEKIPDDEAMQRICTRMQKYLLAMTQSTRAIELSGDSDANMIASAMQNAQELMSDYIAQLDFYIDYISDVVAANIHAFLDTMVAQTVSMDSEQKIEFLARPALFIDYNNVNIDDITRQHGAEVASMVGALKLQHDQRVMSEEVNALIHGGSVSVQGQDDFIRLTQRHEDVPLLKKKQV